MSNTDKPARQEHVDRLLRIGFGLIVASPLLAAGYWTWPDGVVGETTVGALTVRQAGEMLSSGTCVALALWIAVRAGWDR